MQFTQQGIMLSAPILDIVAAFRRRVLADSGTFEGQSCLEQEVNTLGNFYSVFGIILTPNGYKANKLYALKPTNGDFDLATTRASAATRRISSGGLESVATGIPRLHTKFGHSCADNLLELARTNLLLRSEEADNASWTKTNSTITANAITPPWASGATGDAMFETVTTGQHRIEQAVSKAGVPVNYSLSCYIKPNGRDYIYLSLRNGANIINKWFNITTGVRGLTVDSGNYSFVSSKIEAREDGWYRVTLNVLSNTTTSITSIIGSSPGDGLSADFAGDITKGFYVWGIQLEGTLSTQTYASQYIPTTTAAATRNGDVFTNKTGLTSYIGAAGTMYFKATIPSDGVDRRIMLTDGTSTKRVGFIFNTSNEARFYIENTTAQADIVSLYKFKSDSEIRVVAMFATNSIKLFFNGIKVGEDLSASIPTGMDRVTWDDASTSFYNSFKVLAIATTAISEAEALVLSTPGSYPPVIRNIVQATETGDPDYYSFGNGVNLNAFFPDYSIYLGKRGGNHVVAGGNGFGMLYNAKFNLWSPVFETIDDGTTFYSGHCAGVVGNQIMVQVARYTVSGVTDTFQDIGYFVSVDLTTLTSAEQLRDASSWSAFTALTAPIEPRFEAYGRIHPSITTSGKYFGCWFEHDGVNFRLNVRKIIVNAVDNFTISSINAYAGTTDFYEPAIVNCGGSNWLMVARQGSGTEMINLFSSTDDCENWSNVGETNLGSSSGDCVVDAFFYNGLVHIFYQDRGNGNIMQSLNNTYAQCLTLAFNTPQPYDYNGFGDSTGGLGYPSVWEIRSGVFIRTWSKETDANQAHIYFTLDTL